MSIAANLESAADKMRAIEDAAKSLRFCRNVQRTVEKDEEENARRLRQLIDSVDRMLACF